MKKRHHFFNMYFTTTISVALVLLLIGLEAVLLLASHNLIQQVKENVTLTLVLRDDADTTQLARLNNLLTIAPFVHQHQYVSKDDALREHITALGEDPSAFLGYNPLQASYEVRLAAPYAQVDSISRIEAKLQAFPCIAQIIYPKDVVSILDGKVNRLSIVILAITAILLLIALILINNTIRLHVYSKRFLINTMRLVGATPHVIKRPILWRNVRMGLVAAILALLLLAGALYYAQTQFGIILLPITQTNIALVAGTVLLTGVLITALAALFATNRYIRMNANDMYYL